MGYDGYYYSEISNNDAYEYFFTVNGVDIGAYTFNEAAADDEGFDGTKILQNPLRRVLP